MPHRCRCDGCAGHGPSGLVSQWSSRSGPGDTHHGEGRARWPGSRASRPVLARIAVTIASAFGADLGDVFHDPASRAGVAAAAWRVAAPRRGSRFSRAPRRRARGRAAPRPKARRRAPGPSSAEPTLPSTTAELRLSPRSFARFIREPSNAAENSACDIASRVRATALASSPDSTERGANAGSKVLARTFGGTDRRPGIRGDRHALRSRLERARELRGCRKPNLACSAVAIRLPVCCGLTAA